MGISDFTYSYFKGPTCIETLIGHVIYISAFRCSVPSLCRECTDSLIYIHMYYLRHSGLFSLKLLQFCMISVYSGTAVAIVMISVQVSIWSSKHCLDEGSLFSPPSHTPKRRRHQKFLNSFWHFSLGFRSCSTVNSKCACSSLSSWSTSEGIKTSESFCFLGKQVCHSWSSSRHIDPV